jgi:hypothetical protein
LTIGNNPGHGGYKESVKSKGINPRYITELWAATCQTATKATAKLCLASDCAPCGKTQFMRADVKGSPALRFLNHNAYAIADSSNVCCVEGQEYLDPALVLGRMVEMLIGNGLDTDNVNYVAGDPLIKPFVGEGDINGLLKGAGLTLTAGTGYAVAVTQLSTSAVDSNGTAVTASSRPGFVDAKVVVTAITGGGGTGPIAANGYTIAQAGAGYVVGDVVTIATGGANGKLTVAAGGAGLTVGSVVVTSTTAAGVATDTVYTVAQAAAVVLVTTTLPTVKPAPPAATVNFPLAPPVAIVTTSPTTYPAPACAIVYPLAAIGPVPPPPVIAVTTTLASTNPGLLDAVTAVPFESTALVDN